MESNESIWRSGRSRLDGNRRDRNANSSATEKGIVHVASKGDGKLIRNVDHGASLVKVIASLYGTLAITIGKDGVSKGWSISDGN